MVKTVEENGRKMLDLREKSELAIIQKIRTGSQFPYRVYHSIIYIQVWR